MSLDIKDTMMIGRYKGQTVEDVYKNDSGYLLWMRDAKEANTLERNFFAPAVLKLLNMTIAESKSLSKKYRQWNLLDAEVIAKLAPSPVDSVKAPIEKLSEEVAYAESWGAF